MQPSASPSIDSLLDLGQHELEAGAFDSAHGYFVRALEIDSSSIKAWAGKGMAAGWQSNLSLRRFPEMVSAFERVLQLESDRGAESSARKMAEGMVVVAYEMFELSRQHLMEFISVHEAKFEHLDCTEECISVMERVQQEFPSIEGLPPLLSTMVTTNLNTSALMGDQLRRFQDLAIKHKIDGAGMAGRIESNWKPVRAAAAPTEPTSKEHKSPGLVLGVVGVCLALSMYVTGLIYYNEFSPSTAPGYLGLAAAVIFIGGLLGMIVSSRILPLFSSKAAAVKSEKSPGQV
jgi:hypothetical protein